MYSGYPGQAPQGGASEGNQQGSYGPNGTPGQNDSWGGSGYPPGPTASGSIPSTQGTGGYPTMNQPQQGYPSAPAGYSEPQSGAYPTMGSNGAAPGGYPPLQPGNPFGSSEPSGLYPPLAASSNAPQYPSPSSGAPFAPSASYPSASGPAPSGPAFPNMKPGSDQQATYGHLQHAPSFNQASQACRPSQTDNPTVVAAAAGGDPQACWTLAKDLPQAPKQDIIGPFLRFNDYDTMSGTFATSVLVVTHPRLSGSTVQVRAFMIIEAEEI